MSLNAYEIQAMNEIQIASDRGSNKGHTYFQAIKNKQEYNLQHGKDAIEEILPIVEDLITDMYTWRGTHKRVFFHEVVKPAHEKYEQEKAEKVNPAFRSICPEKAIADIVAVVLVSGLSSEVLYSNSLSSMATYAMTMFNVPFQDREKYKQPLFSFFGHVVQHVSEVTDIYTLEQKDDEGREVYIICSPQWSDYIEASRGDFNLGGGAYKPMLVKPKPHSSLVDGSGGYLKVHSPLLKYPTRIHGRIHPSIENFDNPVFFETINKAQEVPYCVNKKLLIKINELYVNGYYFEEYPIVPNIELAKEKADEQIKDRNEKRRIYAEKKGEEYKPLAATTMKKIVANELGIEKSKVLKTLRTVETADEYADVEEFFYPLFLDHRGRRYPYANTALSYQGDELGKALVQFANKEKLTQDGLRALFDTLANTLGLDKETIESKRPKAVAFYQEHKSKWLNGDFTMFPINKKEDGTPLFEEPINAMAIVMELLEAEADPEYKSGYIAHRDARCSGPSIMGTSLRDKAVMEMTSVLDWSNESKLGDAYSSVAKAAHKACQKIADSGNKIAQDLLVFEDVLFSRKAFKFPVMTFVGYGLTEYSLKEKNGELIEWKELLTTEHKNFYDGLMLASLEHAMPSCMNLLKTLKKAAKSVVDAFGIVSYTNPLTGFPIVYRAFKEEIRRVDIRSTHTRIRINLKTRTDKLDKKGMVNATPPNITHSVDASVLNLVEGICDYDIACIHDSIGSHPNNVHNTVAAYNSVMKILSDHNIYDLILEGMGSDLKSEAVGTFAGELGFSNHVIV